MFALPKCCWEEHGRLCARAVVYVVKLFEFGGVVGPGRFLFAGNPQI